MWYIYILRCVDGTFYTGITNNLEKRIQTHNTSDKLGAKYTRMHRPVTLVYTETCNNRSEATKREHAIKRFSRSKKLASGTHI